MNMRIRHCQVCQGKSVTLLRANTMVPVDGLDMSYKLARCNICGFHFAQKLPDEALYLRYYSELSKYDSQPSVSSLDRQRIDAAVELCVRLQIPKESLIVDLGCGFGALLATLRDAGWNRLVGVDPAPQSARRAQEQFGLDGIYQGTLANAGEVTNLYDADLVCLMAVLEHLPQLRRDLGGILSQLRPGARVLVEVPALDLFKGSDGESFGELSLEHIQFFSEQSLCNLFASLEAHVLDRKLLALPGLHSGSLFVLAELGGRPAALEQERPDTMDDYLAGSERRWNAALQRVPSQPFVLYGAGSHSARLIPKLTVEQRKNLVAVLDGNVNLHGKSFGEWTVQAPDALSQYPVLPVLISSYRAEIAIAKDLSRRFPQQSLQLMYSDV